MAASKCKCSLKKKFNLELHAVLTSLRKENSCLEKTLVELSYQHSQLFKLLERIISLEILKLETSQIPEDKTMFLPSEQLHQNKEIPVEGDSSSAEQASTSDEAVTELQNHLRYLCASHSCIESPEALEKNKQWLEYDQEREAYVRAVLDRMLELEKALAEANQACSQQHNREHSDEKERMSQMQEHYERLLQKAKDELEVLREEVDMTHQRLITTENCYEKKEREVEELKQQLETERRCRRALDDHDFSEDEKEQSSDETKDLQSRLDKEKRRSANVELQAMLFQRFMLNCQFADQKKIEDLKRQIKISAQDLEDERQDCSYLKKQMVRVLKMLQQKRHHVAKQSKIDQQPHSSCEEMHPQDSWTSTAHKDLVNESFLECPNCQVQYQASHYRELMNHIDICLN